MDNVSKKMGTFHYESIYSPSKDAMRFAVEKAVRSESLGERVSWNSRNSGRMKFGGSVSVFVSDFIENIHDTIQGSCSGLKEEEDVVLGIILTAEALEVMPHQVYRHVLDYGGEMPECLEDPTHYLYAYIH